MTQENTNINDAYKALEALREAYEGDKKSYEKDAEGFNEKFSDIHNVLDKQEKAQEELKKAINEKIKKEEELESKYNKLESALREPKIDSDKKNYLSQEMKAWGKLFSKQGVSQIDEERKFLRTDNNEQGGYLAPSEYLNELIKKITEVSPVRQVARILTTNRNSLDIPARESIVQANWIGEGRPAAASNSSYGIRKIPVHKLRAYAIATMEILDDSGFNIEREISNDVIEDFAKKEGEAFINGDSIAKPQGLLQGVELVENNGSTANLNPDSFFRVQALIKTGYNLAFMFNRNTLHRHIRLFKGTSNDHYLFSLGLNGKELNTVAGLPYYIANDMPDVVVDSTPVLVGDYRQAYYIVDKTGSLEMLRNPYSDDDTGKIRFSFYKRTGGQVVKPEALAVIKMAV